jgi:alpha-glucosidase
MFDALRFWLKRGVDGFRIDASAVLIEDQLLRDDPPNPKYNDTLPPPQRLKRIFTDDRPDNFQCLEEIRSILDEFDDRVLCGEVQGKIDRIGHFYGEERPRFHLPLNFALLDTAWDALSIQGTIDAYLNAIPDSAWPSWVIGGHDKHRAASKIGAGQARILAMLTLTLKGTPFFFAGDELGREQVDVPPERMRDPFEKRVSGYGLSRDPERTPMAWDSSEQGGFTSGIPWLPLDEASRQSSVAELEKDEHSILHLYRRLISIRRAAPALRTGNYVPLRSQHDILAFERRAVDRMIIALNIANEPRLFEFRGEGRLLLSTYLDRPANSRVCGSLQLRKNEGIILECHTDEAGDVVNGPEEVNNVSPG